MIRYLIILAIAAANVACATPEADVEGFWVLSGGLRGYMGMAIEIVGTNYSYWFYTDVVDAQRPQRYPIQGNIKTDGKKVVLVGGEKLNKVWYYVVVNGLPCLQEERDYEVSLKTGNIDTNRLLHKLPREAIDQMRKHGLAPIMNYDPPTRTNNLNHPQMTPRDRKDKNKE